MNQTITTHQLPNGVTLLGEQMDFASSASLSILVPVGAAHDPDQMQGLTAMLVEMFAKGAGPWDSRELSQQFENIGVHQGHSAGVEVSVFSASMLSENLPKALELYQTVLLSPRFPKHELDNVRQLQLQELDALEDQPSSKVMIELAKHFYPAPFGRCQLGTKEGVNNVQHQALDDFYRRLFSAEQVIIAVAGKFDWPKMKSLIEQKFGQWAGKRTTLPWKAFATQSQVHHIAQDTNQLQIALAYPSVSFDHPDYYAARVAISVLSGGMSGRLFIEVREKRGLVYRVSASHSATKGRAAVFAYAGTTPENGEETLRVMLEELRKLRSGVKAEELDRAKADLKSRLIMQAESTSARAATLVNDWWNIGRVRTLAEIKTAIDKVTSADIERHVGEFPVSPITMVVLGTKQLELGQ